MDVDLARTFLAVVETGSFVGAADRVHVTQSTVSMRIKSLEDRLGKILFERSKAGASLTPAGVQFQKHAQAMVRVWEHAKLEIALPEGFDSALSVGGQYSLWDGFLLDWVGRMRDLAPNVAIRAQMGFSDELMQALVDGTLDLGIMYRPQGRPGYEVELLFEDELVMATSRTMVERDWRTNYAFIDWGPEFRADHSLNFPELSAPGLYLELGSLSVQYLLNRGASGYVPRRTVLPYLETGALSLVEDVPVFSYPAYAVYPVESAGEAAETPLEALREIAGRVSGS